MAVETPAAPPESSAPPAEATAPVESGATEVKAEGQPQAAPETAPPEERLSIMGVEIEKSKVPSELLEKLDGWNKSYTEKSQALSASEKKAKALDTLSQDPRFQRWYRDQLAGVPEAPKENPFELTPERQAELLTDGKKMEEYFRGLATSVVKEVAMPAAQAAQHEAQVLRSEREVESLVAAHPDAQDLIDNDKIQEVVQRYPNIRLEDAYYLASRPFEESKAELKAHQIVKEKVNGSTLPPSGAPAAEKITTLSGKGLSFEDKMRAAFEHSLQGKKIRFDS